MCTWNALLVVTEPNIAFTQPASQGATHADFTANKAVDGNPDTVAKGKLWWRVNFSMPFVLTGIKLMNAFYVGKLC